jgi:hypothetical protein
LENLKVRDHLEDVGMDRRIILEQILEKLGGKLWSEYLFLVIGTSSRVL